MCLRDRDGLAIRLNVTFFWNKYRCYKNAKIATLYMLLPVISQSWPYPNCARLSTSSPGDFEQILNLEVRMFQGMVLKYLKHRFREYFVRPRVTLIGRHRFFPAECFRNKRLEIVDIDLNLITNISI